MQTLTSVDTKRSGDKAAFGHKQKRKTFSRRALWAAARHGSKARAGQPMKISWKTPRQSLHSPKCST